MGEVGQILATILFLYQLVLFARIILDLLQIFARSWKPRGPILVIAEGVYSLTDPPLRLLRRFIPPLRLGGVALDFSFLLLLIVLQVLISLLSR
ncbi:MAG: YggT family protein [Actinomycetota bacterium]|nr:YggT family protein [Actinomycetota bacterium]MDP2288989.1 YggT family protein [Actinomycetota bacterium]